MNPNLPPFTDNVLDRLRHTLAAYEDSPGDRRILTATSDGLGGWTGLELGDLRALLSCFRSPEPKPEPGVEWGSDRRFPNPLTSQFEAEEFVTWRLELQDDDPEDYYITGIARMLRDICNSWDIRYVTGNELDRARRGYPKQNPYLSMPLSTSEE